MNVLVNPKLVPIEQQLQKGLAVPPVVDGKRVVVLFVNVVEVG